MSGPLLLLFGMPRSGTTWIGKIFDSHPDTMYRHEPDTWRRIDALPLLPDPADAPRYRDAIVGYADSVRDMASSRVSGKLPLFPKSYMSGLRLWLIRASVALAKVSAKTGHELPILGTPRDRNNYMVWKSIESLGRLGPMLDFLPSARAVQIIRHPCGFVASVLRGERQSRFVSATAAAEDLNLLKMLSATPVARQYGLTFDRIERMSPHQRLAWRWLVFNETAYQACADNGRYRYLVYEDLCRDPMRQTRALLEFAGLPWSTQTERFLESSTGTNKSDYYAIQKDPIAAAERWREELDASVIEEILSITQISKVGRLYECGRENQLADQNSDL